MTKNTTHDLFTLVTFPDAAQINLTEHELWNFYIVFDETLINSTQHNLWSSYIVANETLICSTEHNLWSFYICLDEALTCSTEHNLWNFYIVFEETLLISLEYTVALSFDWEMINKIFRADEVFICFMMYVVQLMINDKIIFFLFVFCSDMIELSFKIRIDVMKIDAFALRELFELKIFDESSDTWIIW